MLANCLTKHDPNSWTMWQLVNEGKISWSGKMIVRTMKRRLEYTEKDLEQLPKV